MNILPHQIHTAIENLKDGQSFYIDNLRLDLEEENVLNITGWSQYTNFENLTKRQSLIELGDIKKSFVEMLNSSLEFRNFVKDKILKYTLCFDDYGKVSIPICNEKNGVTIWEANIKEDFLGNVSK